MSDMKRVGSDVRAQQVRQAAIRLRREVECDIEFYPRTLSYAGIPAAVAETLAVLRQTVQLLDGALSEEQRMLMHAEFARDLAFYAEYHQVMR